MASLLCLREPRARKVNPMPPGPLVFKSKALSPPPILQIRELALTLYSRDVKPELPDPSGQVGAYRNKMSLTKGL